MRHRAIQQSIPIIVVNITEVKYGNRRPSCNDVFLAGGMRLPLEQFRQFILPPIPRAASGRAAAAVTFDIDDTCEVAHGNQQPALFHAHYDERCFLPIRLYDAANARPVGVLFRPGKTPSGEEIRGHLRRIRHHWPHTRITIRGDSYSPRYGVARWSRPLAPTQPLGTTSS
jgi:hypothetical protein